MNLDEARYESREPRTQRQVTVAVLWMTSQLAERRNFVKSWYG